MCVSNVGQTKIRKCDASMQRCISTVISYGDNFTLYWFKHSDWLKEFDQPIRLLSNEHGINLP